MRNSSGVGRAFQCETLDSKPRVLEFLCTPVRAGVGEHALSLIVALGDYGFAPYIVAPFPLLKAMDRELNNFGVKRLGMEIASPLDWRGILRLAKFFKQERIDLVHCHMADAGFCAAPAARLAGVPRVIETSHGREIWREGKLLKGSFWFDRQISRLIDRYIAVSESVARHLRNTKRIPDWKISVIRNGRDLSEFEPATPAQIAEARAEFGLNDRNQVILMVARFSVEKGHALLIDALRLIQDRSPQLVVLLAGDGPLEAEIRARCEAGGLSTQVRFLGHRKDPHRLFTVADVVVMPSSIEGLPLVAVEALASGRPVAATAVGGTPEVVIDGYTGLLVPPGDAKALAIAIERLLSGPELRFKMGAAGRALVERHYDLKQQIQQTMALYTELINTLSCSPMKSAAQG